MRDRRRPGRPVDGHARADPRLWWWGDDRLQLPGPDHRGSWPDST